MVALTLGQAPAHQAAALPVPVHVRAILVDGQLNQKPAPRLELRFAPMAGGAAATARTDFDGQANLELKPGQYTLTTPSGIDFDGQTYRWRIRFTISTAPLTVTLSNDNALTPGSPTGARLTPPAPPASNLEAQFQRLRSTVATVWSDLGHGSGFIVAMHPNGMAMLLTNEHVVAGAHFLAVQTDATHKAAAILLSEDNDRDVAVLEANLSADPAVAAAKIAPAAEVAAEPEGAPVFTIGSPLSQEKVLTSGIIGKNEAHAFISAINVNHGNSGGPLFAADGATAGEVIGITTFGDVTSSGPGISGIIKITEADAVLRRAEAKFESDPALPLDPLPTVPTRPYPVDALKKTVRQRRFDPQLYTFSFAGYDVVVATPPLVYWRLTRGTAAIAQKISRRRGSSPGDNGFDPAGDLRSWMQYTGEYAPVVWIEMTPRLTPTFTSLFLHSLTSGYTHGRASRAVRRRFQADFGRMELECGGEAIAPISPGRIAEIATSDNAQPQDAAFEGLYAYPPGAISPACGTVRVTVYGAGQDASPQFHPLSPALVNRVWEDFAPWRDAAAAAP
ncbi:MAG TPA: serine protease [Terriglobales bacterium]|nr:serine protease [Terriglobales bacterium]